MNTQLITAGILIVYPSADKFPTIASFQHINNHRSTSKGSILVTELGSTNLFSHKTNTSHRHQSTLEMNTQFSYGITRGNRFVLDLLVLSHFLKYFSFPILHF
eukprot:XP_016661356.1 PREDICTED: uncharacterized protein LOC107884205 [Acyrthosiphon pisum]